MNIKVGTAVYLYNFSRVLSTEFELAILRVIQHFCDILQQKQTFYCQYLNDERRYSRRIITMTSGPLLKESPQMPVEIRL
jgi:hypothetical protein